VPLLLAPLLWPGPSRLPPGGFELRVFDVGHGLAVLVRTRSRALLYDTGPAWTNGAAAEWTVLPALRALGVRHLDAVVLSHGHADHVGGLDSIRASFPHASARGGHGAAERAGRPCRAGQSWQWEGVRFMLLHPPEGFRGGTNEGSCVLLVAGPGGRVLLTGDIERRGERAVLRQARPLRVDAVVAPHHGSTTSSGAPLVGATRPAAVVFSTNWKNRWGFPAERVVRRWQAAGALPLSTDRHGEVVLRFPPAGPVEPLFGRARPCAPWLDCVR
jgi:competence protein ComEC